MTILPRKLLLCLALLAFAARSFIPLGFMPGQGSAKLVICSGAGAVTIDVPAGKYDPPAPQQHHHQECPYAMAFAKGLPPCCQELLAGQAVAALLPIQLHVSAPQFDIKAYFSQGPPSFLT